jgi:hypothetical protein
VEPRRAKLAIDRSGPGAPERERAQRRASPGTSRREWALVGLVALLVAALAFAALRARQLESRVGALAGELARSQALVAAHREHLRAVRGGVAAVREELAGLEALAAAEPDAEASAP